MMSKKLIVCMTVISVGVSGISVLDIHAKWKKTLKCPTKNQSSIQLTFQKEKEIESASIREPVNLR